jgi:hypothetical protein
VAVWLVAVLRAGTKSDGLNLSPISEQQFDKISGMDPLDAMSVIDKKR